VGNDHYVGVFSYAGMPPDEAERNLRLFAAEVLPACPWSATKRRP